VVLHKDILIEKGAIRIATRGCLGSVVVSFGWRLEEGVRIASLPAFTPFVRYLGRVQSKSPHATLQEKCMARFSSRLAQSQLIH